MGAIIGVIFHFLGGFASGSFYAIFKNVKKWAWESYWLVGGLFSWLIVPPLDARTRMTITLGILTILASVVLVGYGNSLT